MEGYLLETSTLSAYFDVQHEKHAAVKSVVDSFDPYSPTYVSTIALAELRFGAALFELSGKPLPKWHTIISGAIAHVPLDITHHTSAEYAELKANVAAKYLKNPRDKKERKRWIENWVDKATGQILGIDENDLWMCAQAREHNLVLVTTDKKIQRIADADAALRLWIIK